MGGLAHYLENHGLATTQISLIREHTEKIRPPRALWVPFEMGRPLGRPNDPGFQDRVLWAALELLEAEKGPILRDWSGEAPGADETDTTPAACPIDLGPKGDEIPPPDTLADRLIEEFRRLQPWYEMAVQKRGRTTVGGSRMDPESIVRFIAAFLAGEPPRPDGTGASHVETVRLAVEDLKALYTEAASAQPGLGSSSDLAGWFWGQTVGGQALLALKTVLERSPDEALKSYSAYMIPRSQAHRLAEG